MNNQFGLPQHAMDALIQVFRSTPEIETVILFGSRAKGCFKEASDIDLCLIAPHLTLRQQLQIENQIDDLLLPWKVDLITKHRIDNQDLLDHINRVGRIIYKRCPKKE